MNGFDKFDEAAEALRAASQLSAAQVEDLAKVMRAPGEGSVPGEPMLTPGHKERRKARRLQERRSRKVSRNRR